MLTVLGGANAQSVQFSGAAESVSGSTDDSGAFTASCTTGGSSQLSLQFQESSRIESRQITKGKPTGSWEDSSGNQHQMTPRSLYSPPSWFCPVVALSDVVSATNLTIGYVGDEEKNGANLAHFTVNAVPPGAARRSLYSVISHGLTSSSTHRLLDRLCSTLTPIQTMMPVLTSLSKFNSPTRCK